MGHKMHVKNPELYHGKETSRPYFEGWYFKQTGETNVCVIPGVFRGLNPQDDTAFIQFASAHGQSFFFEYPYNTFHCNEEKFEMWIEKNFFSMKRLKLNINKNDIIIKGELELSDSVSLKTSAVSPSIMGFFSYLPNMQCNHGVLSLTNSVNGTLKFNEDEYVFEDSCGYIEKDWGEAFPEHWIWMQCNDNDSSLMCSIASIPYGIINFTGLICVLLTDDGKQYRFATYNGGRAVSIKQQDGSYNIEVRRSNMSLSISAKSSRFSSLKAPTLTGMDRDIKESISTEYKVVLKKRNKEIFSRSYKNGGLEMLNPSMLFK